MKRTNRFVAVTASLLAVSFAAFSVACSGEPGAVQGSDEGSVATDDNALEILFPTIYSAYDGTHAFKVPAMVAGVKKLKWSASDPTMVDLAPSADGSSVMITMRKAGSVTLKAQSGSLAGTAKLTIEEATPDDWESGNARYNNGIVLPPRGKRDGGRGEAGEGGGGNPEAKQAACTNCHGSSDVQHTPMQTGGYTDDELIAIFTKGEKPEGVEQRIMPYEQWHRIHQWAMNEDATKGVVIYLRSLEPKSQGAVDWGGRGGGKRDGGGGGHRDGGS
ncbi:MAG: hypothetical protein JWM74_2608 [Myxococcaceae bacterium]|nr:hypothetical protein [Myxococcaceae bacterium]